MSFDFMNNNGFQNSYGSGAPIPNQAIMNGYGFGSVTPQPMQPEQQMINNQPQQPKIDPRAFETPAITTGTGIKFTVKDKDNRDLSVPVDNVSDVEKETKKLGRPRKETVDGTSIVRASSAEPVSGNVENVPTAYTYMETTGLLRHTLNEIDSVNSELMYEFESVKNNRALKNKYGILNGLSENIGSMISNKIAVIKEINNSISKSNDLDYKRYKDAKAAAGVQDDDKMVSDLYKSFISNAALQQSLPNNIPMIDLSAVGNTSSGIVRADMGNVNNAGNMSYTSYIANATPEQRLMMAEANPNIKQAMIYNQSTGAKAFQYFDFTDPNNPIPQPGLPTYSEIMLDEFTVDLTNRLAKSINLKETMKLVVV